MKTVFRLLFAATLLVPASHAPAAARPATRDVIALAIPDRFPAEDAAALVIRRRQGPHREIILLREDATAATLAASLATLHRARSAAAVPHETDVTAVSHFVPRGAMDPAVRAQLEDRLRELRARPVGELGNVGPGRWMEVALRPRAR